MGASMTDDLGRDGGGNEAGRRHGRLVTILMQKKGLCASGTLRAPLLVPAGCHSIFCPGSSGGGTEEQVLVGRKV